MADWKKSLGPAVELDGLWYSDLVLKRLSKHSESKPVSDFTAILNEAKGHYERELELFKTKRNTSSKSESKWMKTVFQSGTSVDKINAHALLITESPVHSLSSVKSLIGLIELKVRRQCMQAIDALLQAFTSTLLPDFRKLLSFSQQNLPGLGILNKNDRKKALILFVFEEELKVVYDLFIKNIGKLLKDPVDVVKRKGVACLEVLLAHSPEQEQELLSQLVNKVGDPQRGVAAFAVSHLETLLRKHPNMKLVVVSEIERFLYRPNVTRKAQYFGLCFLNQILLSEGDSKLATKLVMIYISFFKACIKKEEVSSKIMSAILTGVNRAYPYAQEGGDASTTLAPHLDTLYRLVHVSQFNISVQALCLLHRAETGGIADSPSSDRFYSALYKKLLDSEMGHSNKVSMLLNLLYQSLKPDQELNRVRAFVKRLLQVGQLQSPGVLCGILYLISELFKTHRGLLAKPILSKTSTAINSDSAFSDDEEHYEDVPLDDNEPVDNKSEEMDVDVKPKKAVSSWIHRQNVDRKDKPSEDSYDPNARNPLYARAETSEFWELSCIRDHYHPSVSLFAKRTSEGGFVDYTGDPLQDFQLIRFLDRFVFRNPKAVETDNPNRRVLGRRHLYKPKGIKNLAVNSEDYLNYGASKIPVDELVFYKYFTEKAKKSEKRPADLESLSDDEFDDYMESMSMANFADEIKESKPDAEEEGDELGDESDAEFADDDEEPDFGDDPEFNAQFGEVEDILGDQSGDEFDEEGFGSDDEYLEEASGFKKSKKTKKKGGASDFAQAEDFADIMEQNADGLDVGGSEQILNADKAGWKQLKWEQNRANQMNSDKWRNKKKDFKGKKQRFGKMKHKQAKNSKQNFVKSKRK